MPSRRGGSSTASIPFPSSEDDDVDQGADADNAMQDAEDAEDAPVDDPTSTEDDLWNALPPRNLKEISSLATWTVSSSKPGCSIQALRAPNPQTYWQSDGPQPHHLNIHFFKQVRIVHMRFYVDAALDESYTPRKLHFLAGTGLHDLREVCTMALDAPRGWVDVDLARVGGPPAFPDEPSLHARRRDANRDSDDDDNDHDDDDDDDDDDDEPGLPTRPKVAGGTLLCFLVQVRISENHQNGKDTHLRGLQIFARDEEAGGGGGREGGGRAAAAAARTGGVARERRTARAVRAARVGDGGIAGLRRPGWMAEAVLR